VISRLIGGRFEALERVGEGDLFMVYKARDHNSGRVVAIKSPQAALLRDAAFVEALLKAAPPLTSLAHASIARLEEVGDDEGTPYLVSEFVRGINLKERIRRIAPFTLSVAVDFAIAIAEALQHAHAQRVVHGDLRSNNVIVSPEGAVKVTDFGIERALRDAAEALSGSTARSISYQAPEVASGRPVSPSSDIYSLGAILFEMLTGALPYPGDTPQGIAQRIQSDDVPSPRALNPGVPRSLEGITMKALMKRPEQRYGSASELLADLKAVRDALRFGKSLPWSPLEGVPGALAPAPPRPASNSVRRSPNSAAATAVNPAGAAPAPEREGAARMATYTADDRISPYLKAALYAVIFVLIAAGIGFTAFWMATFAKPPEQKFPDLNGMTIEQARAAADKASIRLLVHDEFKDNVNPGIVYQVDQMAGRPLRPGRSINVWVSKGSRMVYVPDLTNLPKDEAEQKLKDAGLTLGAVNREYSAKVPFDSIVSQNPKSRKRVDRDLPINLSISDGPKPDDSGSPINTPAGDGTENPSASGAPNGAATPSDADAARADEAHSVNLTKKIPRDGQGSRNVRIEYDDSRGTHKPIDERHDEGETVSLRVDSYGPTITVRVYYNEDEKPVSERTMRFNKP
jgi:hypothetical protein